MLEEKKNHAFFERNSWYHRTRMLQQDGTTKYGKKGGFVNPEEAEESYKVYEKKYQKDLIEYNGRSPWKSDITLSNYLVYWLEEIYSPRVANSSKVLAHYVLRDWVLPYIEEDIKLRLLTASYIDDLLERSSTVSASAGNTAQGLLNIAFKDALRDKLLQSNPIDDTKKYRRPKPRIKILSKQTLKKFLAAASTSNWYLEILLALFCGLRKGEILGLKFSDFDLENGVMYVQRQIQYSPIMQNKGEHVVYQHVEKEPKTPNSYRAMRVPSVILKELEKRQQNIVAFKEKYGDNFSDHNYVCCQENGNPRVASSMNTALTKLCKRNGIPTISVHGLRHMYATILLENGVSLARISALLGHSSIQTTFEYYCDIMDENDRILDFMNEHFSFSEKGGMPHD